MASVAISGESSVITTERRPGRIRMAAGESFGYFGTWLRVLWRHWPVMLAFALAGTIARELFVGRAIAASAWHEGLGGLLVYPLIPMSMLVPMVLMLRVIRPSLPYLGGRRRPEPVLVYIANVMLPFLVFYVAANYAVLDYIRFGYQVAIDSSFYGEEDKELFPGTTAIIVVALIALALRFVLTRTGAVRRFPLVILPAVYLEVLWIFTTLFTLNMNRPTALTWLADSRIGQATLEIWHRQVDQGTPLGGVLAIGRSAVSGFLDSLDLVLLAPIAGLVAGSVVLAARARRRTVEPEVNPSRLKRVFRVGLEAGRPIGGRLTLLADGLRRVFQAGVVSTMVFCLGFVALGMVSAALFEPIRLLIGPQSVQRIWVPLYFPLSWLTDAVELVLILAFIAAFVDRTAARIARRSGAMVTEDPSGPSAPLMYAPPGGPAMTGAVLEQATVRLGAPPAQYSPPQYGPPQHGVTQYGALQYGAPQSSPPATPQPHGRPAYAGPIAGAGAPGTPTFGGLSPVTPVYSTPVVPPPTPGTGFGPTPGLAPPPSGPSATPPAGLAGGLWEDGLRDDGLRDDGLREDGLRGDGKPDVPGKPLAPGDDDRGWSGFGRQ